MNELVPISAKIDKELKKKAQKQALDIEIDFREYVELALHHYSEHIENGEITFSENLDNDEE